MLSNIGRASIKRVGGSSLSTKRFIATVWQSQRVEATQNAKIISRTPAVYFLARRSYATATKSAQTTSTKAEKPATAKKAKTSTAAAKKPAKTPAKKSAKKPATKKKPAKKAATKAKKPKSKSKLKAKPKKVKKAALTEKQKEAKAKKAARQAYLKLKETALLTQPAKRPEQPFQIYLIEKLAGTKGSPAFADIWASFKALSTQEMAPYNQKADENRAANAVALKKWILTFTPDQTRLANNARAQLRKKSGKKVPTNIRDERHPTRPIPAMFFYCKDRRASGDYQGKGLTSSETNKQIAVEFRALSPAERQPYDDAALADLRRYHSEIHTVFNRAAKSP